MSLASAHTKRADISPRRSRYSRPRRRCFDEQAIRRPFVGRVSRRCSCRLSRDRRGADRRTRVREPDGGLASGAEATPTLLESLVAAVRRLGATFKEFDVLITPTLARLPVRADAWHGKGAFTTINAVARYVPFTTPWNLTGQPAASVPAGFNDDRSPSATRPRTASANARARGPRGAAPSRPAARPSASGPRRRRAGRVGRTRGGTSRRRPA
jgi:Asp-tRNA(Asn)/Glu-tRNA(Gln) amidotransferase A subunit family amidase